MFGLSHYVPCQLLHVGRIILYCVADACCYVFRNVLAILLKALADKPHPVFCGDAIEVHHFAKLIKWHALVLEDVFHEVPLAAKEAVGHPLMVLPYSTQTFLNVERGNSPTC